MNNQKNIKFSVALILILGIHIAYASISFTGSTDYKLKTSKYTLKNFSTLRQTFSINNLKSRLRYNNSDIFGLQHPSSNNIQINSMMCYERGNTTYIMPYKYKVRIPKFKTPTPNY